MEIAIITGAAIAIIGIGLLFVVLRRAVRFVVRLALAGILVLALLVGAIVMWYKVGGSKNSGGTVTQPTGRRPRAAAGGMPSSIFC